MNLFILDKSPAKSAEYACDKYCIKIILEACQMLCNCFDNAPYKRTHYNHPMSIAIRTHKRCFEWTLEYAYYLCQEYTKRYGKTHKCITILDWIKSGKDNLIFENIEDLNFPLCMPEDAKIGNNIVESYRNYYMKYKSDIAKWKMANIPFWYVV